MGSTIQSSHNAQKISLTSQDIMVAFTILSQSTIRVTKEDIHHFLKTYFPNLPPKIEKLLLGHVGGQKNMFKLKEIQSILKKKENNSNLPYSELAKIFESQYHSQLHDGSILDTTALKLLIDKINETIGISLPQDLSFILKSLDLENERFISVHKWNQIGSQIRKQA